MRILNLINKNVKKDGSISKKLSVKLGKAIHINNLIKVGNNIYEAISEDNESLRIMSRR